MPNNTEDPILLTALSQIHFLTLKEKIILWKNLDSADNLALLSINDISGIVGRQSRSTGWNGQNVVKEAVRAAYILNKCGIRYVLFTDPVYPALLRETVNAPFMLFYRGHLDILCEKCVSVVGTRCLTPDGAAAAFSFAHDAANAGNTVVSGLAFGTDAKAHEGAVSAFMETAALSSTAVCGKTAAVLPGGIDEIVPHAHGKLSMRILESGGCLLSEYAPGVPVAAWRYVQRNRIIAALSPATVVIQAPPGSGALLTADFALEYGRDVMFHESVFSAAAEKMAFQVRKQLEIKVASGEKNRYKLENTPEKYINDGAPVIKNYRDYTRCLAEVPGERNYKKENRQLPLFDMRDAKEG